MQKGLSSFLDTTNFLCSGFRSNHSTSSVLMNCTETISNALDSDNHVYSVLIDLRKPFDTVAYFLSNYDIRRICIKLV